MIVKTLLAVIIFAGVGTIIIGGAYLIGGHGKIRNSVFRGSGVFVDGSFRKVSNIQLPVDATEAEKIVKEFCEFRSSDAAYGYNTIKEVDNEWRIQIVNMNGLCYAAVNIKSGETNCEKCDDVKLFPPFEEVIITTDKTEYEQEEIAKITVKNNLNNQIKHLKGVGCSLQGFSNKDKEWINASSRSCKWDGEDKLEPNSEYNFNWSASGAGLEKHRIAFHYQEQRLIETKEIDKIICEGENISDELEKLLLNGEWTKNDVEPCIMCSACGCGCTVKNVWAVGEAVIDVHFVSCGGSSYTIRYKDKKYSCVSENHKPLFEQVSLYLKIPEGWKTIYSNEFTIKEKSALDLRCSEKVEDSVGVNNIDCAVISFGYEFDSVAEKCVMKAVNGCSFETPFETLEECREVCEKSKNVTLPDKSELIRCSSDNDCVLVNSGCCGCSMGGGMTCINKKYLDYWNRQLSCQDEVERDCPAVYLCDDNPTGCECVNNVCQGTGGGLIKL